MLLTIESHFLCVFFQSILSTYLDIFVPPLLLGASGWGESSISIWSIFYCYITNLQPEKKEREILFDLILSFTAQSTLFKSCWASQLKYVASWDSNLWPIDWQSDILQKVLRSLAEKENLILVICIPSISLFYLVLSNITVQVDLG